MDKRAYQIRVDQWTSIVQNQAASNLSKSAWCKENGINVRQFYYWQKKLRDTLLDTPNQLPKVQAVQTPAPAFCELHVSDQSYEPDPHQIGFSIIIEINECRILVGDSFSPKTLSSVLEVLRHV